MKAQMAKDYHLPQTSTHGPAPEPIAKKVLAGERL